MEGVVTKFGVATKFGAAKKYNTVFSQNAIVTLYGVVQNRVSGEKNSLSLTTIVDPRTCAIVDPRTCAIVGPRTCAIVDPRTCAIVGPRTCAIVGPRTCAIVSPRTCAIVGPRTCLQLMRVLHIVVYYFKDIYSLRYIGFIGTYTDNPSRSMFIKMLVQNGQKNFNVPLQF